MVFYRERFTGLFIARYPQLQICVRPGRRISALLCTDNGWFVLKIVLFRGARSGT